MTLPFTFDQLQALLLVIDTGSFSLAANHLGISQPAVSAQIKELERKTAVKLLERVGRTVGPTAAGVELAGHARALLDLAAEAAELVSDRSGHIRGTVRLGTGATACLHLLPPLLQHIKTSHPGLHVVVSTGNTEDIVRRVELNTLDLALVALPVASRALTVSKALSDDFVAVAAREFSALPRSVTPLDFAESPLVLFEPAANTRSIVEAWLLSGGVRIRPAMELGSVEAIKEMVAAGLGCSILPKMALTTADRKRLQVRPLKPSLTRDLGIVLRQDKPLTRGIQVLIKTILECTAT